MSKYRIRVEVLDANEKLDDRLIAGIECEGYCIAAEKEVGGVVSIQDMSVFDIASAITKSTELLNAAIIAKAMEEGRQMKREREKPKEIKVEMPRLFRQMVGED